MFEFITTSNRWQWIKTAWMAGNYRAAALILVNGLPNLTYPFLGVGCQFRGEESYDFDSLMYRFSYGSENDLRAWRIVMWREVWHLIGALLLFNFQYLASYFTTLPFLLFWSLGMVYHLYREFWLDPKEDGKFYAKNIVDLIVWSLPGVIYYAVY